MIKLLIFVVGVWIGLQIANFMVHGAPPSLNWCTK